MSGKVAFDGLAILRGVRTVAGRGRPCKTWTQVVHDDLKQLGLDPALAQDRYEWKKAIANPIRPTLEWKSDVEM